MANNMFKGNVRLYGKITPLKSNSPAVLKPKTLEGLFIPYGPIKLNFMIKESMVDNLDGHRSYNRRKVHLWTNARINISSWHTLVNLFGQYDYYKYVTFAGTRDEILNAIHCYNQIAANDWGTKIMNVGFALPRRYVNFLQENMNNGSISNMHFNVLAKNVLKNRLYEDVTDVRPISGEDDWEHAASLLMDNCHVHFEKELINYIQQSPKDPLPDATNVTKKIVYDYIKAKPYKQDFP
ncbi:hypothetical protein O9G_005880 [Rozella allomycis CSF55]|uniref:Uncharacterized protein n=2 Tax=Rozella allomycis (strain CSF55) TaxID=988480 RepID=A0A075ANH1_ROZAC|nr:hypothetical protein O9G_005880 [Rozella allomycis CSF55]|eukprot:EPZ31364.1 hypothetical protein O9G_005880 [Rozella allomycis CSF55]